MLTRLRQDVVEVEKRLGNSHAAPLLEVNEKMVLATLRAQTDAETATQALKKASQSAELDALTELPIARCCSNGSHKRSPLPGAMARAWRCCFRTATTSSRSTTRSATQFQ